MTTSNCNCDCAPCLKNNCDQCVCDPCNCDPCDC